MCTHVVVRLKYVPIGYYSKLFYKIYKYGNNENKFADVWLILTLFIRTLKSNSNNNDNLKHFNLEYAKNENITSESRTVVNPRSGNNHKPRHNSNNNKSTVW